MLANDCEVDAHASVHVNMLMTQGDTGNAQVNGTTQHEGENIGDAASIVELMSNESACSCRTRPIGVGFYVIQNG